MQGYVHTYNYELKIILTERCLCIGFYVGFGGCLLSSCPCETSKESAQLCSADGLEISFCYEIGEGS